MVGVPKEVSVADMDSPAAEASPVPDKGVADLLKEAYDLYRKNARALLLTCAVLFVPASVLKSCVVATILGPALAATAAVDAKAQQELAIESSKEALQRAYENHADAATLAKLNAAHTHALETFAASGALGGGMATFTSWVLMGIGQLIMFFIYGVAIPLTSGALVIAAGERLLGGSPSWSEAWAVLLRRLAPLLTAVLPAAIVTAFGFVLLTIPGVILGLLFSFVAPVVLLEGKRGREALQRSVALVSADWLRVAIMVVVFVLLTWGAKIISHALLPTSALFVSSLFFDLLSMLFLPLPAIGMVLLYLDIRRKRDGFTNEQLRAALDTLKAA
jgi:hypothetical protein